MTGLPRLALSVRQPWAWAILHAGKDIENRSIGAVRYMQIRTRIAVHASKGMTREEYEEGRDFMRGRGVACPPAAELIRGGIIGSVYVAAIAGVSASKWFIGPRGLVLREPVPCDFVPAVGQLGYFEWKPSGGAEPPARWMMAPAPAPDLFGARP